MCQIRSHVLPVFVYKFNFVRILLALKHHKHNTNSSRRDCFLWDRFRQSKEIMLVEHLIQPHASIDEKNYVVVPDPTWKNRTFCAVNLAIPLGGIIDLRSSVLPFRVPIVRAHPA